MNNKLLILLILYLSFCFIGCGKTKFYEFLVENQLRDETVKIVPKSKSDFWITSNENYNYICVPGEIIVIGYKVVWDDNKKKATDIYKSNDVIEPFDVYIDDIKQEKILSYRKFWDFSLGKVNESGVYVLIIDENVLKD